MGLEMRVLGIGLGVRVLGIGLGVSSCSVWEGEVGLVVVVGSGHDGGGDPVCPD